ncbi:extracellular solute-binding protein [Streptomyces alkaliphilus]|uniref:Extracellular solute-binding protein n=1 Tax=Streptomyces alkaliphilus TaxID=1472722 RepID=A0A7W3T9R9_9ACTN|nr:extracellular solute-binding protein [Streptomyces alkaliphilus]MBB0242675.1 extracellular solute-binding protein [Streptomyces alkaliphilus]
MRRGAADDDVVIEVWLSEFPFPGFLDPIRERAREFERAHPGYRIDIRGFSYEKLPLEVARAAAEGTPPAIATYYAGASQLARDARARDGGPLFVSVEKAVAGRTEILGEPVVLDDVLPGVREYYTVDGDFATMPLTLSTMLLYSNSTALRAAGVGEIPRTWEEVTAACRALADHAEGPRYGIAWPIDGKFMQHALAQQGALLTDAGNGRHGRATTIDLTSAALGGYVDWWRSLHREGHYLHTGVPEDWAGTFGAFVDRTVALRMSSSFDANYMVRAAGEAGFDIEVGVLPRNGAMPCAGNWIGGDSLWLVNGLDEAVRDGALAFMQYLNSPRAAAEWHKASGSAPATYGAIAALEEEGWFDRHPHHRVTTEQLELRTGPPEVHGAVLGAFHAIQIVMMEAMEDVLTNDAPPRARFARAEAAARELLDSYNAYALGTGPETPDCLAVRI